MLPSQRLRLYLILFLFGTWLGLYAPITLSFLFLTGAFVFWISFRSVQSLSAVVLCVALAYTTFYQSYFYASNLETLVGQSGQIKAQIASEPKLRSGQQTLRLKVLGWRQNQSNWQALSGQILWERAPLPLFQVGDEITLQGVVGNLSNYSEDFNAKAYWSRWGVGHQLIRAELITRPPPQVSLRQHWRGIAQERLQDLLDKPHLTVALGMLVGLDEKLPKNLQQAFKNSGLQHLLVVSGTNVTLLLLVVALLLKPLGPWWRYGLSLGVILWYLYLVGFDPPALRATLFGALAGLALTTGYFCEYRNLLLLVATSLVIYDPRFLTHDISFQLSFMATAGMVFAVPLLYQGFSFVAWKKTRLLLAATTSAQLAVFPLLIYHFESFPYIGLLTNLVTEPLVPLIMLLSAGGVILGDWSLLGLENLWQFGLYISLESLIRLAQISAQAPTVLLSPKIALYGFVIWFGFVIWASFSSYYQRQFWQKFEQAITA